MGQELAGKVAIVTGGVNGIGRGIVELFLEEGAKVVAGDIDEAGGEAMATTLGDALRFKRADVASREDIQALVDFAVSEFGELHVMVNNAGFPSTIMANAIDLEFEDFENVMNINVLGTMLGSVRAARHMAKHGGGSIINISSVAGILAGGGPLTYRAAKAGVNQFSRSLAIELARFNIRVNVVAPYNIVTQIAKGLLGPDEKKMSDDEFWELDNVYRQSMIAVQPLKRQGQTRDIANATLFFASDRSLQVTGTILPVDGAYTAGDPVRHAEQIAQALDELKASRGS